jgi:alkylhydroperoxidase family enzyme
MQKEDTMLSPKERAAVVFARKLTKSPQSMSSADFSALKAGLGEDQEALEPPKDTE